MHSYAPSRRNVLALLGAAAGSTPLGAIARKVKTGAPWTPELLGEQVWLDWRAEDLVSGPVASWKDRKGGVVAAQANTAKQPTKLATGEVQFLPSGQFLTVPNQSQGHIAHRSVVMLFRADLAGAAYTDGCLFALNGIDGGTTSRQPAVLYSRQSGLRSVGVDWHDTTGPNVLNCNLAGGASSWHCLVSRRVDGRHYLSLDGSPEITIGDNICLAKNNKYSTGLIGDLRSASVPWAADTILILQDELGKDDADRLAGWGMWRCGAQGALPANHPYRLAPPTAPGTARAAFVESTPAEWTAVQSYWDPANAATELEQAYLAPLDLAGYRLVFEDHFTALSVSDQSTGRGTWWSPVAYNATGSAISAKVSDTPYTFIQSGSELAVRMQPTSRGWTSGVFTSVNANGRGNTWKYGYFEFRARAGRGNGYGVWPAFWLKSVNEFFRLTESRVEIDLYEGYSSDPAGHHQSFHNWPANRVLPGRLAGHRYVSNYTGLKPAEWGGQTCDLFDDQYHLYGLMIDETWVRYFYDNRELARFPTPVEAKQELFILVDLALLPSQAAQASGTVDLTLDYIRVYQR